MRAGTLRSRVLRLRSSWRIIRRARSQVLVWLLNHLCVLAAATGPALLAQELTVVQRQEWQGRILAKTNHSLQLQTANGPSPEVLFQDRGVRAIPLPRGGGAVNSQTQVQVLGKVPLELLRPGHAVEVELDLGRDGRVGETRRWQLLPVDHAADRLRFADAPPQDRTSLQAATVQGVITKVNRGKLQLRVPPSEFSGKNGLELPLALDASLQIAATDMVDVRVGDEVLALEALQLNTGDWIAGRIRVQLAPDRSGLQTDPQQQFQLKYRHLSDQGQAPREVRSKNFLLKTDLSPRSAQILLDKLEEMFSVISKYYNRRSLDQPIVCYVAQDLDLWGTEVEELREGLEWIQRRAGVTVASRLGNLRRAVVYACGDHQVVQHEAVHAFCHLAFGGTGPTWYAEGMAELGCYWRPGDAGVNIDPVVIRYLTTTEPPSLTDLVRPDQVTGDSWQAYAWRWALCYLLVNNPNYNQRFYRLGERLMPPGNNASFQTEFADGAAEIDFEYQQMMQHLGNGYRQDLCSWNWKQKTFPIDGRGRKSDVAARGGWQATGGVVKAGQTYEVVAAGEWAVDGQPAFAADGQANGRGQLIGAILTKREATAEQGPSYVLSDEIPLGSQASFTAPADGQLFLRCREPLTQIDDNQGKIKVTVRRP